MTHEQTLTAAGYKLVTRAGFDAANDVPAGIREVAAAVAKEWGGAFIVYDPNDDATGWLLVGDNRADLARETVESLELEATQPSLF